MVNAVTGMTTVALTGNVHVALFCASRLHTISKSTLPLAVMVLPLVQSHEVMGAKSMWPLDVSTLLLPSLFVLKMMVSFFYLSVSLSLWVCVCVCAW